MQHHFSIEIAEKHGVNEAIFLENIAYWIWNNKANNKHFYEDRYWTYNTQKAFQQLFPYWSRQNLRTIIKSCYEQELILKGNFNKSNYDQTQWYSLTDSGLKLFNRLSNDGCDQPINGLESTDRSDCGLQGKSTLQTLDSIELLESTNGITGTNQPIPYINTDNKQRSKAKTKAQSKKQIAGVVETPDWIDPLIWEEFKQHRKELKKPMTALAQKKTLNQLDKMRQKGQNVEDVLNQSIANGWQGIFEVKQHKEFNHGEGRNVNASGSKPKSWSEGMWDTLASGSQLQGSGEGKSDFFANENHISQQAAIDVSGNERAASSYKALGHDFEVYP